MASTPATSGEVTKYTHDFKLKMRFEPSFAAVHQSKYNPPWFLEMEVRCHDLPSLMLKGFQWTTADNVDRRASFFTQAAAWKRKKYSHFRQWIFSEDPLKGAKAVQWYGTIKMSAMTRETLSAFRLEDLSRNDILSAEAFNKKKKVFEYNRLQPERSINTIYDGLHPTAGSWWIWPMERPSDAVPPYTDDGAVAYKPKEGTPALGTQILLRGSEEGKLGSRRSSS